MNVKKQLKKYSSNTLAILHGRRSVKKSHYIFSIAFPATLLILIYPQKNAKKRLTPFFVIFSI